LYATGYQAAIVTVLILLSLSGVAAQVRSSSNFQIQSDSVNLGGGLATSSSYDLESTIGEIATGRSTSSAFSLRAGYQQMQEVFISVSDPGTVTLEGTLGGITGGESNGSTTVTVITDSPGGYQLSIVAEAAPALRKGSDTIADYVPDSGSVPDYLFATAPTEAHLGFSPVGIHTVTRYRSSGGVCNVGAGSSEPLRCWDGLSTTPRLIAQGAGANHPSGATTTLQFKVGFGGSVVVPPGMYVATTTLTAIPL
jgi:hypothetical protein